MTAMLARPAATLSDGLNAGTPAWHELLTAHEVRIALLVADGLTNRAIAAQLDVVAKTVEYHLSCIFARLAIRSRVELAVLVAAASAAGAHTG